MKRFIDQNGEKVALSFTMGRFSKRAEHVLVICRYGNEWLLTDHPIRGLEFPGGKIECGETIEGAAKREAYEETGALLQDIVRIGEYEVGGDTEPSFVKAIVYAEVGKIDAKQDYLETRGPVLIDGDYEQSFNSEAYSFIMQDEVVKEALLHIREIAIKQ